MRKKSRLTIQISKKRRQDSRANNYPPSKMAKRTCISPAVRTFTPTKSFYLYQSPIRSYSPAKVLSSQKFSIHEISTDYMYKITPSGSTKRRKYSSPYSIYASKNRKSLRLGIDIQNVEV